MKKIFIITLSFFFSVSSFAQKGKMKKGNKKYQNLAYIEANEKYNEAIEAGENSPEVYKRLANTYYFNNKMEEAIKWYTALFSNKEVEIEPEYYYRIAQAYKYVENYKYSDLWMQEFVAKNPSDSRAKLYLESKDYLSKIDNFSGQIILKNAVFNSEKSDFGAFLYEDEIYFASNRKNGKKYKWNNEPFLDIYKTDSTQANSELFNKKLNTKLHESSIVFTPNGEIAFFTRNNIVKNREYVDSTGVNLLQLFRAKKDGEGNWGEAELVEINNENYSIAHPTINNAGTKIYYASDMPGTLGKSDIFVSTLDSEGNLGTPKNLGELVNTEGQETFPFINEKGDLFFASNGHVGLGGLDNFVIREFEFTKSLEEPLYVENMGIPVNSSNDDFAYAEYLSKNRTGFVSSNRKGGKGNDDVYTFKVPKCYQIIDGIVKERQTDAILVGAKVALMNKENQNDHQEMISKNDGTFSFKVDCEKSFRAIGSKEEYSPDHKDAYVPRRKKKTFITLKLNQLPKMETIVMVDTKGEQQIVDVDLNKFKKGQNLRELLGLKPIQFDYNKSSIRKSSREELLKIIQVLKKYPKMRIKVESHTDARGKASYNLRLSKSRNKSTVDFLIKEGKIDPSRIEGEGFGETRILNKCKDGVKCTDKEHEENRRSDFIVLDN
ncbi:OmpA family protein [Aureivirga sp. CE67]|uniref:OmpA family protein n=1 Tax=Aureivirga sp. CE67 TaxID=1788983 RepID=UPI0018C9578E|nr:OmpA family protein [Aureivirga sp. CE67]